jgi:hypothetical protein
LAFLKEENPYPSLCIIDIINRIKKAFPRWRICVGDDGTTRVLSGMGYNV